MGSKDLRHQRVIASVTDLDYIDWFRLSKIRKPLRKSYTYQVCRISEVYGEHAYYSDNVTRRVRPMSHDSFANLYSIFLLAWCARPLQCRSRPRYPPTWALYTALTYTCAPMVTRQTKGKKTQKSNKVSLENKKMRKEKVRWWVCRRAGDSRDRKEKSYVEWLGALPMSF
jgi:hypothetical protein